MVTFGPIVGLVRIYIREKTYKQVDSHVLSKFKYRLGHMLGTYIVGKRMTIPPVEGFAFLFIPYAEASNKNDLFVYTTLYIEDLGHFAKEERMLKFIAGELVKILAVPEFTGSMLHLRLQYDYGPRASISIV